MDRVDYETLVIQEILGLNDRAELDLNPWYQRRSVWTRTQQAYLINTLFEGKPVPTIYIRHSLDLESERSIREVVDGQQRLKSILGYVEGDFTARYPGNSKRISYKELTNRQKKIFLMTKLSIGYLINATDADVIEIFGRLNSVSKNLNSQEKRNARYSGEFKQFCLRQAADRVALWRSLGVFSANDVARMLEVQFISDLTLNMLAGLSDYSAEKLNKFYSKYDEEFDQAPNVANRLERILSHIASINPNSIRDTIFSRQPIFFSLLLVLDSLKKLPGRRRFEESLHSVDDMFNMDVPLTERKEKDAEFIEACTSSTQRIKSRTTRHAYLMNALKL